MKNLKLSIFAVALATFGSCIEPEQVQVESYPEKEVTLNATRIFAESETAFARIQASPSFPEYSHDIPTEFLVYFIATTGSDQGKVIVKLEDMGEGSHQIVVPSRPYKVVITNYEMDHQHDKKRNHLPETSKELYLYGESFIDYKTVSEGEVSVTNDYAASMILKTANVKGVPSINGTAYADKTAYYLLYLRDQSGATSFTRNTLVNVLKTDGATTTYNHNYTYKSNSIYRFLFNLYSETNGSLNITVDENILKNTEDIIIVPAI